jgi:hypothetical protein
MAKVVCGVLLEKQKVRINMQIVINVDNELYEYFSKRRTMHDNGYFSHVSKLIKALRDGQGCDIQRIIPKRVTECPNPNCDYELSTHHGDGYYSIEHKPNFCPNCGQALLWEDE